MLPRIRDVSQQLVLADYPISAGVKQRGRGRVLARHQLDAHLRPFEGRDAVPLMVDETVDRTLLGEKPRHQTRRGRALRADNRRPEDVPSASLANALTKPLREAVV